MSDTNQGERGEFCHNRLEPSDEWCGKPAEFIVWGKLYPAEALGPRCYDCAAAQIGHHGLYPNSHHAIYHLPKTTKGLVRDPKLTREEASIIDRQIPSGHSSLEHSDKLYGSIHAKLRAALADEGETGDE